MRPTFLGFETAKRGIMISQKGLDIVGHNIMNQSTPGYTRQRVDVYAVAPNTYATRIASNRTWLAGQGVDAGGVSQVRDQFLDRRFREQYGEVGYYDKTTSILEDIESALSEYDLNPDEDNPMGTGLQNALNSIVDTLKSMGVENADSTTHATLLYTQFQNMTQMLQQMDTKLKNVAEQAKFDLGVAVDNVNIMLEKIADLNYNIAQDMAVTKASNGEYYGPNELMDERNLLIDELSSYGDLLVEKQADGTVTLTMNGHTVVEGFKNDAFNLSRNDNGTVRVAWQSTGKDIHMTKGEFKGALDMINGRGVNAHETGEVKVDGIRFYQDKLNAFAATFANVVNNTIPETTINATTGVAEPVPGHYRTLIESIDGKPLTASNITMSKAWTNNKSYFIYQEGNKDATYVNQMLTSLQTGEYTFIGRGEVGAGLYTGTFMGFVDDYQAILSTEISFHKERLTATATIAQDLADRRSAVSDVSQEEETVDMMKYTKAFQASSRVMTALDEALDVIINKMGLVGR